jgi:hypothetical protein
MLDARDKLLAVTVNLAPPPKVPNACWFDNVTLLKKYHKLPPPAREPSAFGKLQPLDPGGWAYMHAMPAVARKKLLDREPVRILVLSGPETRALELWNLPGKPVEHVFHNLLREMLVEQFNVKKVDLRVLGNVTDSIRSDGRLLLPKLKAASDRATAAVPEELEKALGKLEPIPKGDFDDLVGLEFDLLIVFFSYLDTGTDAEDYVGHLQTIVKAARERMGIRDIILVSPLPDAADIHRSATRAARLNLYCRDQKIVYADLFGAVTRNGYWALREGMIDEHRLNWKGHEYLARILLETFQKTPEAE